MIAHLSYVTCDRCGRAAVCGDDATEARIRARQEGYERRNWNKRIKDVCPDCARGLPAIESDNAS